MTARASLPINRPGKVICVGLNYRTHAEEAGLEVPAEPMLFGKWSSALIGPDEPIRLPDPEISSSIDYEAELGVVIGKQTFAAMPGEALSSVAGYTCFNDVSARDLQRRDGQWTRAKSLDTFGPVGPAVAPADAGDPQDLLIRCVLNGEVVQEASTADMVFGVAELIAHASQAITLEPGDLLATGTPAGIGSRRVPPAFLVPGDEIEVHIERVGVLRNPVVAGAA